MTEKKARSSQKDLNVSRKKKTAQPDNKAGLYARVLDEAEALDFETASGAEGLDDEITIMRLKIRSLLENNPEDIRTLVTALDMLVKLVKTRYSMDKKQEKNLGEAITRIIRDIGVPLGVTVLNKKL